MKKYLVMIFMFLIIGCERLNNKIELIEPSEEYYLFIERIYSPEGRLVTQVYNISDDQVKKVSEAIKGVKEILLRTGEDLEIKSVPKNISFTPNKFLYTLFIDEKGKIKKVIAINSFSKEVDKYVADQMKNWQMEIYKIGDESIKYSINWEFGLFRPKGENKLSLLNSNLKASEQIENEIIHTDEYFVTVEEMPSPIGGMKAIQEKIKYPELARKAGIEGRVYVKAFIDENGNVTSTEVIKGIEGGCNETAIEAVKNTKFEPGRQKGKPVKVQVTIPILFKLGEDKYSGTSIILGEWKGKSNLGEEIKISFYNDGTTNLYKSNSGIMDGKRTGATFWPDFQIDSSVVPYKLDLNIKGNTFLKSILKFVSRDSIIIGRSVLKNNRPENFNEENIYEMWKLKRTK